MAKGRLMKTKKVKIERSSGNVFADLEYPDAETHLLKVELVGDAMYIVPDPTIPELSRWARYRDESELRGIVGF